MGKIRDLPTVEIQFGIERCKARLRGYMPMGIMTKEQVVNALSQYRQELARRSQKEIFEYLDM
jgi:hypothetical protein